jgi:ATP-dependent DNA ligase
MQLPVNPPVLPMLAKRVSELPRAGNWIFEPKWDGFRALIFRDGKEVFIQSRDGKPLNRYFPELIDPLLKHLPARCVLDGELVIAQEGALDFDALQLRLHPAASRVKLLSEQIPSSVVFFDLLAHGARDMRNVPFVERRQKLQSLLAKAKAPIHVTPATTDLTTAADWFRRFEGAGLDGVVAKSVSGVYESNKRVMLKIKHERECDCVVAGFRWHKKGDGTAVGSLLLGLFDDSGRLQHVGVCASFTDQKRLELVKYLAPYRKKALDNHPWKEWAIAESAARVSSSASEGTDLGPGADPRSGVAPRMSGAEPRTSGAEHRMPGGYSRWSQGKDLSWEPLRPELVVEVAYDHMQGERFRHTAQFRRWRSDKKPADCTFAQLEVVPPHELETIFATGR